ncbi:MAG: RNA methyltransferase [Treponema sp.]|nr:RNA methyltransferase [Treponema sp.]MBQ4237114.1 RNA methyltransferase [Treponema sp.]MBQ5385313.1 RNA methyltransferase [Treponema sp.]
MKNTLNGELAVCGFAAVKTLEKIRWQRIRRLYFSEERASLFGGLCKKMAAEKRPYNVVKPEELEKLCGSVHHQGVVAMIDVPEILPLTTDIAAGWVERNEDALLLDRVGNANNLGAIVRSAAFFGIKNIVIPLDEAQSSVTTSSYRVAEGGMEFVNIYSIKSIPRLLAAMEGKMLRIGTALDAKKSVRELKYIEKGMPVLAVLGNEENGISKAVRENVDSLMIIPFGFETTEANIDSLNVAQASAVLMYEMSGRRASENKNGVEKAPERNRSPYRTKKSWGKDHD